MSKASSRLKKQTVRARLLQIYDLLLASYGIQHWWPAKSPFEVMVGAVLTQSCAWRNVEKAISALKKAKIRSPRGLRDMNLPEIAELIRPCGYYNVKARKLRALAHWLEKSCGDDIKRLSRYDTESLRKELLGVYGIGEETADSIMLYALGKPVFVIDAYTRRILSRLGLKPAQENYAGYQSLLMNNLPSDARLFNEYHALLVYLGKEACRKIPLCHRCPLYEICQFPRENKRRLRGD